MHALSWLSAGYLVLLAGGRYLSPGSVQRHHLESASFIFVAATLASVSGRRAAACDAPGERTGAVRTSRLLVPAIFLLSALALFAPTFSSGLYADDYVLLEAARSGRWTVWTELFRPAIFLVWRIADRWPVDVAVALHLLNVLLHALNAVLTVRMAARMTLPAPAALAAGVLFLCYPASVEAVSWPAGIQDVLMTAFALGFVLVLTGGAPTIARGAVASALFLAACLTKESGITAIPVAAVVCAAMRAPRRTWIVLGAVTIGAAALLALRFWLLPLPDAYGMVLTRYHVKEVLVRPFATLVVPFREAETATHPWLAPVVVIAIVSGLGVAASRWGRNSRAFHRVLLMSGFVLASVAAVNAIFFVTDDLLGSRYLYLASAGWAVLLATVLREVASRSIHLAALLGLTLLATWVGATVVHVRLWKEAAGLRESIVAAALAIDGERCAEIAVRNLPEVRNGVPLFINGFPEAVRLHREHPRIRVLAPKEPAPTASCAYAWTGEQFRSQ